MLDSKGKNSETGQQGSAHAAASGDLQKHTPMMQQYLCKIFYLLFFKNLFDYFY